MTNTVSLLEIIDFMEKRCVGVDKSADEARWKLIRAARAPAPNALDAPCGIHGLPEARQGAPSEPRALGLRDFIALISEPVHLQPWMRQYVIDALTDLAERRESEPGADALARVRSVLPDLDPYDARVVQAAIDGFPENRAEPGDEQDPCVSHVAMKEYEKALQKVCEHSARGSVVYQIAANALAVG
jgi:hypothetical protein